MMLKGSLYDHCRPQQYDRHEEKAATTTMNGALTQLLERIPTNYASYEEVSDVNQAFDGHDMLHELHNESDGVSVESSRTCFDIGHSSEMLKSLGNFSEDPEEMCYQVGANALEADNGVSCTTDIEQQLHLDKDSRTWREFSTLEDSKAMVSSEIDSLTDANSWLSQDAVAVDQSYIQEIIEQLQKMVHHDWKSVSDQESDSSDVQQHGCNKFADREDVRESRSSSECRPDESTTLVTCSEESFTKQCTNLETDGDLDKILAADHIDVSNQAFGEHDDDIQRQPSDLVLSNLGEYYNRPLTLDHSILTESPGKCDIGLRARSSEKQTIDDIGLRARSSEKQTIDDGFELHEGANVNDANVQIRYKLLKQSLESVPVDGIFEGALEEDSMRCIKNGNITAVCDHPFPSSPEKREIFTEVQEIREQAITICTIPVTYSVPAMAASVNYDLPSEISLASHEHDDISQTKESIMSELGETKGLRIISNHAKPENSSRTISSSIPKCHEDNEANGKCDGYLVEQQHLEQNALRIFARSSDDHESSCFHWPRLGAGLNEQNHNGYTAKSLPCVESQDDHALLGTLERAKFCSKQLFNGTKVEEAMEAFAISAAVDGVPAAPVQNGVYVNMSEHDYLSPSKLSFGSNVDSSASLIEGSCDRKESVPEHSVLISAGETIEHEEVARPSVGSKLGLLVEGNQPIGANVGKPGVALLHKQQTFQQHGYSQSSKMTVESDCATRSLTLDYLNKQRESSEADETSRYELQTLEADGAENMQVESLQAEKNSNRLVDSLEADRALNMQADSSVKVEKSSIQLAKLESDRIFSVRLELDEVGPLKVEKLSFMSAERNCAVSFNEDNEMMHPVDQLGYTKSTLETSVSAVSVSPAVSVSCEVYEDIDDVLFIPENAIEEVVQSNLYAAEEASLLEEEVENIKQKSFSRDAAEDNIATEAVLSEANSVEFAIIADVDSGKDFQIVNEDSNELSKYLEESVDEARFIPENAVVDVMQPDSYAEQEQTLLEIGSIKEPSSRDAAEDNICTEAVSNEANSVEDVAIADIDTGKDFNENHSDLYKNLICSAAIEYPSDDDIVETNIGLDMNYNLSGELVVLPSNVANETPARVLSVGTGSGHANALCACLVDYPVVEYARHNEEARNLVPVRGDADSSQIVDDGYAFDRAVLQPTVSLETDSSMLNIDSGICLSTYHPDSESVHLAQKPSLEYSERVLADTINVRFQSTYDVSNSGVSKYATDIAQSSDSFGDLTSPSTDHFSSGGDGRLNSSHVATKTVRIKKYRAETPSGERADLSDPLPNIDGALAVSSHEKAMVECPVSGARSGLEVTLCSVTYRQNGLNRNKANVITSNSGAPKEGSRLGETAGDCEQQYVENRFDQDSEAGLPKKLRSIRFRKFRRRSRWEESPLRSVSLTSVNSLDASIPRAIKSSKSLTEVCYKGYFETDIDDVTDAELTGILSNTEMLVKNNRVFVTNLDSVMSSSEVPIVAPFSIPEQAATLTKTHSVTITGKTLPRISVTSAGADDLRTQSAFEPFIPDRTEFARFVSSVYKDSPYSSVLLESANPAGLACQHRCPRTTNTSSDNEKPLHAHEVSTHAPLWDVSENFQLTSVQARKFRDHRSDPNGHQKRQIQRDSWDVLEKLSMTQQDKDKLTRMVERGVLQKSKSSGALSSRDKDSWNILDLKIETLALPRESGTLHDDVFVENEITATLSHNFKRDSSDVGYLFEKYQVEREALKSIWKQRSRDGSSEGFSDISSLSESCSEPRSDTEGMEASVQSGRSLSKSALRSSARRSAGDKLSKHLKIETDLHPTTGAPEISPKLTQNTNDAFVQIPPLGVSESRAVTVHRSSIAASQKPDYLPNPAILDDEDLSNVMIAKAASAVRDRRRRRPETAQGSNAIASSPSAISHMKLSESPPNAPPQATSSPQVVRREEPDQISCLANFSLESSLNIAAPAIDKAASAYYATTDSGISEDQLSPRYQSSPEVLDPRCALADSADLRHQHLTSLSSEYLRNQRQSPSDGLHLSDKGHAFEGSREPIAMRARPSYLELLPDSKASSSKSPLPFADEVVSSPTARVMSQLPSNSTRSQSTSSVGGVNSARFNQRSYERIHSLPNMSFKHQRCEKRLDSYDSDDYLSENSLMSDSCLDSVDGSSLEDAVLVYPSIHLQAVHYHTIGSFDDAESDSSVENSFNETFDDTRGAETSTECERTVHCGYSPCSREQKMSGREKPTFTSCPSCFTCYCSRSCRRSHWPEHKRICFFGRLGYYIRSLIRRCEKDHRLNVYLTRLARKGFAAVNRGVLMYAFPSQTDAKIMLQSKDGLSSNEVLYLTPKDLGSQYVRSRHLTLLEQTLKDYDPEQEFVVNISVNVSCKQNNTFASRKRRTNTVLRCARISFVERPCTEDLSLYQIRTFSLPKTPGVDIVADIQARRYYCREISYSLKRCGVRLKEEYPGAYTSLCRYIGENLPFPPIILYGQKDGRNYKCLLYPDESNPQADVSGVGIYV